MKRIFVNNKEQCLSIECPWQHECAQNFQSKNSEDFRPDLLIDIDNGDIYCKVIDATNKPRHKGKYTNLLTYARSKKESY